MSKKYSSILVRNLCVASMLAVISAVFGKFFAIPIGNSLRISFENLPIILSGICFGPWIGLSVGIIADLLGCLIKGYSIIPMITLGAVTVGLFSGLPTLFIKNKINVRIIISTALAHITGNMIVKTWALHIAYGTPWKVLVWRIPIYIFTMVVEAIIISLLFKYKPFTEIIKKR